MTRYVFEEVHFAAVKSVPCSGCGKKIRRQRTFTNTLNPWNVNAAGDPVTYEEAREKLRAKAAVWVTEPEAHSGCSVAVTA